MYSRISLILLFLLAGAAGAPAQQQVESVYTDLADAKCRTIEFEHEGYSWTKECPGVAGYKLHLLQGDERESVTVIRPDGSRHPLELWSSVSPAFSSAGPKAEWRVRRRGGRVEPFALVVRYNAKEDPVNYRKTTSYLVVARLAPGKICVTGKVAPGPRANELARRAADDSAGKPCLPPIGEEAR